MIRRLALGLIVVGLTLVSANADPFADRDLLERRALAAQSTEITGMRYGLGQWRQMLTAQDATAACGCNLDPEIREKLQKSWVQAVENGFDEQAIIDRVETFLAASLSVADLKASNEFDASELGQKLIAVTTNRQSVRMDGNASGQLAAQMAKFTKAAKILKADPARAAVIAELIVVTDAVNGQVQALMAISQGSIQGAMNAIAASRPRISDEAYAELMEDHRKKLETSFTSLMPSALQSMYAELTTAQLKAYIEVRKTEPAIRFNQVQDAGFIQALRDVSEKIGAEFAKDFERENI